MVYLLCTVIDQYELGSLLVFKMTYGDPVDIFIVDRVACKDSSCLVDVIIGDNSVAEDLTSVYQEPVSQLFAFSRISHLTVALGTCLHLLY